MWVVQGGWRPKVERRCCDAVFDGVYFMAPYQAVHYGHAYSQIEDRDGSVKVTHWRDIPKPPVTSPAAPPG